MDPRSLPLATSRFTAAVCTSSRLVSASCSAVAVSPATIVFVAIGQKSPRSVGSRPKPCCSVARPGPLKSERLTPLVLLARRMAHLSSARPVPRLLSARPVPRQIFLSRGGDVGSVRVTGADLVEGGHQGNEPAFGFPGQTPRGVLSRQIDFFAQTIDIQEPEDVPPSFLRLRRHGR